MKLYETVETSMFSSFAPSPYHLLRNLLIILQHRYPCHVFTINMRFYYTKEHLASNPLVYYT